MSLRAHARASYRGATLAARTARTDAPIDMRA
jgi:hypothetical protein